MTKQELMDALRDANIAFNTRMPKDELEKIYKLHVHQRKTVQPNLEPEPIPQPPQPPEPAPEPEPAPIPEPTPAPEPAPGPAPEPEPAPQPADETDFNELLGRIQGADVPPDAPPEEDEPLIKRTRTRKKKGASDPDSTRIEGYILLTIVDVIYPVTLAWLNNMFDKKVKVKVSDLQLPEKDFAKLEPLADQAADYLAITINPVAGFFLVATFLYANNLIIVRMQAEINKDKIFK